MMLRPSKIIVLHAFLNGRVCVTIAYAADFFDTAQPSRRHGQENTETRRLATTFRT